MSIQSSVDWEGGKEDWTFNGLPCSKDFRLPPRWYWLLEVSAFAIVVTKNVLKKSFLMSIKDLIGK